jgi:hypothetical protein
MQAKARQSEAKLTLNSAYTSENAFSIENQSFSGCLANIGFGRDGNKFFYTIGFNAVAGGCGPDGQVSCLASQYRAPAAAGGAWTAAGTNCAANNNETYFAANSADGAAAPAATAPTLGNVSRAAFTIGANGRIRAAAAGQDVWTIDNTKNLLNTTIGL